MPRIGTAFGIAFYVYKGDHNPPHVHAICGEHEAALVIATGDVLIGSLPPATLRQAKRWLADNRALVAAAWERLQS